MHSYFGDGALHMRIVFNHSALNCYKLSHCQKLLSDNFYVYFCFIFGNTKVCISDGETCNSDEYMICDNHFDYKCNYWFGGN